MKKFLISTTDEVHEALRKHARERGLSLNGLIRSILWDWLDAHKL